MAVTFAEAIKRIQNQFIAGVADNLVTVDQFLPALPVMTTDRHGVEFNYVAARQAAECIAAGGSISEGATTSTLTTLYPERFIREVRIPNTVSASDGAFQLAQAARAVGELLASDLVNGTGVHATPNPKIASLVSYTGTSGDQVIDAGGAALSFTYLDQVVARVKVGGMKALVMNENARFKFNALMRASGGVPMMEIAGGLLQVPSFNGVPVLTSNYIPSTDPGYGENDTSVFCVSLDPMVTQLIIKTDTVGAEAYDSMVEVIGPVQVVGSDNQSWKVGTQANLMIRTPEAVARLYRCAF